MIHNDHFWRVMTVAGVATAAFGASAILGAMLSFVRRNPLVPVTAAVTAAVTALIADRLTEEQR
jgi:anti-sigma-K factor RskA